jgi:exodeoxyribonuclease-5
MTAALCAACGRPLRLGEPLAVRNKRVVHHAAEDCVPIFGGDDYQRHRGFGLPQGRAARGAANIIRPNSSASWPSVEEAISRGENFARGLAGTGKTTVAAEIAWSHPDPIVCAPTAKAASELSSKTGVAAATEHSAFYHFDKEVERDGKPPKLVFLPKYLPGRLKGRVLVLDECSMISRAIADDTIATGITVIAFGDPGQLPPVEGDPFFIEAGVTLKQIHRQALESPIIRQAHAVGTVGRYEADGEAVRVIDKATADDLRAANVVLIGLRNTRMRMNDEIRRVLGLESPLPRYGEPLICLRTAQPFGLYNGAIYRASPDHYKGDQTIGISTDDGDIEVQPQFLPPYHEYDKLDLPPGMTAFAFGYALTVHLAQGSEFDRVLLIDEWHWPKDRTRWLYTGITRAKERIVIARDGR